MPLLTFIICLLISALVAAVGGGGLDTPLQVRGLFFLSLLATYIIAKIILNAVGYIYPMEKGDNLPDGFWGIVVVLSMVLTVLAWITRGFGIYGPLELVGIFFKQLVQIGIIGWVIVKIRSR